VSEAILRKLDDLEGHPEFYKRELADIEADGKREKAWIYLCESYALRYPVIESGVWEGR
jgi:gamma-glutamylcyclotransferase (GGCT)/AIG2-like uncharacterized protein YtfP